MGLMNKIISEEHNPVRVLALDDVKASEWIVKTKDGVDAVSELNGGTIYKLPDSAIVLQTDDETGKAVKIKNANCYVSVERPVDLSAGVRYQVKGDARERIYAFDDTTVVCAVETLIEEGSRVKSVSTGKG